MTHTHEGWSPPGAQGLYPRLSGDSKGFAMHTIHEDDPYKPGPNDSMGGISAVSPPQPHAAGCTDKNEERCVIKLDPFSAAKTHRTLLCPSASQGDLPEYIPTHNAMGYATRTLDEVQNAFVAFASHSNGPALDIGCAFGNTTLPVVRAGTPVVGQDLDASHLCIIADQLSNEEKIRFHPVVGAFPHVVPGPPGSFGSILMAMVLHFILPEHVAQTFRTLADLLAPGGHLFLTASSPYQGLLQPFWPIYDARLQAMDPHPGYIASIAEYVGPRAKDLPQANTLYTPQEIANHCQHAGLHVTHAAFFSRHRMPPDIAYDGREYAGVIAMRPEAS